MHGCAGQNPFGFWNVQPGTPVNIGEVDYSTGGNGKEPQGSGTFPNEEDALHALYAGMA